MKKALMLAAMLVMTSAAYAQSKGEIDLTAVSGPLFSSSKGNASGATSTTTINPEVIVGYYFMDKIRLDGGLGLKKATGANGVAITVGGRYDYWKQDKIHVNGGLDLRYGLGKGYQKANDATPPKMTNPMDLTLTLAEASYWPMEGGGITAGLSYAMNGLNLGDAGSTGFGIGLGLVIRFK